MTEQELKGFIRVLTEYFLGVTGIPASMGIPYVKERGSESFAFTGVIGISGSRKGGIYITAGREILSEIGRHILGENEFDDEGLYDLVGEITNTIAGNVREFFGPSFLISIPIIVKGCADDIVMKLKPPVFIIPLEWKGFSCRLAVGLE